MADFHPPRDRTHGDAAPTTSTPGVRRLPGREPGPAGALIHLQSTAGNHAVQRLLAGTAGQQAVTIQRQYVPTAWQKIELDQSRSLKEWTATYDKARATLLEWCQNHAQALSVVNNLTWEEFRRLRIQIPSGANAPIKVTDIKAQWVRDRTGNFRNTGKSADGWGYSNYLAADILTVTHIQTFRTDEERQQGKNQPKGTVPYTRNFKAKIGGKDALWEIHIHYAGNNTAQKGHAKLITDRHTHNQIANLAVGGPVVTHCNAIVNPAQDADARGKDYW